MKIATIFTLGLLSNFVICELFTVTTDEALKGFLATHKGNFGILFTNKDPSIFT